MQKMTTRRLLDLQRSEQYSTRMEPQNAYLCADCGAQAVSHHASLSVSRFCGSDEVSREIHGYGLGTWHCPNCDRKVKVRRAPLRVA